TRQISASGRATVQVVIPYIDLLTNHVDKFARDETLLPCVRAAAKRGRAILDKYYERTDENIVHRNAMVFTPRYKLQYFRTQDWPEEWITEARDLAREEYRTQYKPAATSCTEANGAANSAPAPRPGRRSATASTAAVSSELVLSRPATDIFSACITGYSRPLLLAHAQQRLPKPGSARSIPRDPSAHHRRRPSGVLAPSCADRSRPVPCPYGIGLPLCAG
ncbi:hypothetical protein C8T65DRAFT_595632, partial [Cerioporus squamosus]